MICVAAPHLAAAAPLVLAQPVRDDRGRWLWPAGRLLPQATAPTVGAAYALLTLVTLVTLVELSALPSMYPPKTWRCVQTS